MEDSRAEFDAHDMELMARAQRETDAAEVAALLAEAGAAAAGEGSADAAPGDASAEAAAAAALAPDAAVATVPAAPASQGDTRAALRASRRAERAAREEIAALRRRLEEEGIGASSAPREPDEAQLDDVREYAPEVGTAFDRLKAENEALRLRMPPSASRQGFLPDVLPEEIQSVVDEIPELLQWQISPEHQGHWQLVKDADRLLMNAPRWAGKPYAARFQAAMALVREQVATPSKAAAPKTLEDAQRVIAAAAAAPAAPVTVGDLRGGATPTSRAIPDYRAQLKAGMSDEELIATLPVLP